jgi:TolB-like protein/tetratricopeptide (TPR) repeat protein
MATTYHASFAVGNWLVEPDRDQISTPELSLYLRPQVMQILVYLAELEGKVASLESIHDDLWAGKVVSTGTIYNCIAELRQLLARDGSNTTYIETIPKKGYRLAMPLVSRQRTAETSEDSGRAAVAVMPLLNRSRDLEIEYLCEGIAEDILYRLYKVGGLKVYSAFKLKQENLDPRVVGLRLSATAVLTGSLQSDGSRLRLTFILERVRDGAAIWSERYDGRMEDIFEVQELVATQVVTAMSRVFSLDATTPASLQGTGTRNPAAFNAFLLGKHLAARYTRSGFIEAIPALEEAVRLDPAFARAHYILHQLYYSMRRDFGEDDSYLDKARAAAAAARKYGYQLPVPWIILHRRLYPESRLDTRGLVLEALDKIRLRDPEWSVFAYEQLSWVLPVSGHFEAALACALRVLEAPEHNYQDSDAEQLIPMYQGALGQHHEAIRQLSIEIQRDPAAAMFRRRRSVMYVRTGQLDYARCDLEAMEDGTEKDLSSAFYHFYTGDPDRAREISERLRRGPELHPNLGFFNHMLADDLDAAMACYLEAATSPLRGYVELGPLRIWTRFYLPAPLVERVEQHPRFLALLAAEGIDTAWCEEVTRRLNDLSGITGILVEAS